ncbi:PilZ domain-containing protein [Colwellia sp. 4_MG-2023]|jgi:hypothetical protein|uniref:PilZ domain-containing protein n=1 Tax=unclassified Colwellia TaxID=196834 RepID=UPI001C091DDA|nr:MULTISPECIES: PilZ domain-containing protein [unclassified Colwellia]MBU2926107.1 PilZ domain-containing protein [Colwellia sp. C2M11]MDO6487395.1 PilZ domain-containing protein [Colwellia sp. 6_MG-2023]MDO6508305.1 PilZ domain-containing protein [Colwellia sp. 5_MG-2023]MDO6556952.1 PilZ domain-containing protein [Colwellia sp. 4_MG-2023]MDO6652472.1 PilZ domain-containing protein [Colwellia sp. 3_MG-2023]
MMNDNKITEQEWEKENQRLYKRWYLNHKDEHLSLAIQRSGIAVKLKHPWLFGYQICQGVIKNVSVGGAGLLVPAEKKLPKRVVVAFNQIESFTGLVKYSKSINEQLKFVGLEWATKNEQERMDLVANLQALSKQEK